MHIKDHCLKQLQQQEHQDGARNLGENSSEGSSEGEDEKEDDSWDEDDNIYPWNSTKSRIE